MKKIYILLFIFCTVIFTQSCSSTDTSEPVEETNDDEVDPTDDEIPIPESWQKTIGGIWYDQVNSMIQTADGGFILCGTSNSSLSGDKTEESRGGDDVWIIKLSANGTIQWDKTYGGSEDDFGFDILQTADGGYIVAATSESNISGDKTENSQGGPDYWVLKLNSDGTLEWQNTIGGDQTDVLKGIVQTPDGGYMLAGHSGSDISGDKTLPINLGSGFDQWYVKISSAGIIQDQKDFSFPGGGYLKAFKTTTDNSFISGINIQNGTGEDYLLYKSNASGSSVWQRHFGGDQFDILEDVIQTTDGGYIVCGGSGSNISGDKTEDLNGNFDYWILKIDSSGAIEWQNSIGGNELNWGYTIIESSEGGYLVSGHSNSNISGDKTEDSRGEEDYWLVKLNELGEVEWDKTLGGNRSDQARVLLQTEDGGYVIAGTSYSGINGDKTGAGKGLGDIWILKYTGHL